MKIEEAMKLPRSKPVRSTVNWAAVIVDIIESEEFHSAAEVTDTFVENKVLPFRTRVVLDRAHEEGILARLWNRTKWVYGKRFEE